MNSTTDHSKCDDCYKTHLPEAHPLVAPTERDIDEILTELAVKTARKTSDNIGILPRHETICIEDITQAEQAIATHYRQKFERLVVSAKPEEYSHGDAHPYSSGYNVALDDYEANLRAKLKEEL